MFVLNVRSSKKLTIIFFAVSIVSAVICIICMTSLHNSYSKTATNDEIGEYSLSAKNTEEQMNFLGQFGYTAIAESEQTDEIIIPCDFNEVYEEYNVLQKQIGLNLENFKGKNVLRVRFELKDSEEKYAVLLIYNGKVVGAHLTNGEYGQRNLPLG